jgi:hypothetical protein
MIPRRKLLPAIVVCFVLFALGVIVLVAECSTPQKTPSQGKAPGTRSAFETMQAQAMEIAAVNDKFVDGVIRAQRASVKPDFFSVAEAGKILQPSIAIAEADRELAATLNSVVKCGAGGKTPAERDKAAVACAKASTAATIGMPRQLAKISGGVVDAKRAIGIVKNRVRHEALTDELERIGQLAAAITAELKRAYDAQNNSFDWLRPCGRSRKPCWAEVDARVIR